MRVNAHACVLTRKLVLVPYAAHHVPKYHKWMKDPEIQEATASEPLTLEEEYAMQRTWRTDGDKLTFIICEPFKFDSHAHRSEARHHDYAEAHAIFTEEGEAHLQDEIDAMIGDINLFISLLQDDDTPDDEATQSNNTTKNGRVMGEIELMIAERSQQGNGYGKSAVVSFLNYIAHHERQILNEFHQHTATKPAHPSLESSLSTFDHFSVKIGNKNHRSIALFQGLGFGKTSEEPNYFGEFELRLASEGWKKLIVDGTIADDGQVGRRVLGEEPEFRHYRCACDQVGAHVEGTLEE